MVYIISLLLHASLSKGYPHALVPAEWWRCTTHTLIPYPVSPGLSACSHSSPLLSIICPLDYILIASSDPGFGSVVHTWFLQLWLFMLFQTNDLDPPFPFWVLSPSCGIPNLVLTCQALVPKLCDIWPVPWVTPFRL